MTHSFLPNFSRLVLGAAEEAGMKAARTPLHPDEMRKGPFYNGFVGCVPAGSYNAFAGSPQI